MILTGQFPGPTIEARSGDRLEITVRNKLPYEEGTSLHWHGLRMRGKAMRVANAMILITF
jgi:FtsP/CotA-like multicopper oxidase with cupredoxin domain